MAGHQPTVARAGNFADAPRDNADKHPPTAACRLRLRLEFPELSQVLPRVPAMEERRARLVNPSQAVFHEQLVQVVTSDVMMMQ